MLVSDHVVKLNCFTVRDDFFAFPIDFFWGLPPSLYADEVLCAACRAALPPHMPFVFRKNRKWRNSMQVHETLFLCNRYALPPHILFLWRKIIDISLQKKVKKTCQRKLPKLSSRSNQSSTFAILGGSKMSLQEHSERQGDSNIFPKMRKDFAKNPNSSKCQHFRSNWHWHADKITQKFIPFSVKLECAKSVTFFQKC